MVPRGQLQQGEHGLIVTGEGWFVANARDLRWRDRPGRGAYCDFEGRSDFPHVGVNIQVLAPGEPMAMYHWEADQEDFLVVSGRPLLIIEDEQRQLKPWDLVHCPAGANHVLVGAGDGPSVIVAIGARVDSTGPNWGGYTVSQAAVDAGAGVEQETTDADVAYARFGGSSFAAYRDGWLPGR
jgi:uncharacterized cupin superfamily protein